MKKMRKIILKDDLTVNPPKSGKKLKTRPPLSSARILRNGVFGSDLKSQRP
jgi:hypothetical protein